MNFTISISTRDDLSPKLHARRFADSLLKAAPSLVPQRMNNYEPIRHVVGDDLTEEFRQFWEYPVLWTRRSPKVEGSVWFGNRLNHSSIKIEPICSTNLVNQFDALIRDIATWLTVDLAYIYNPYDEEDDGPKSDGSVYAMSLGVATMDLKRGIPDLAWRTYFGQVYIDLIGRERLLSCPAATVAEVDGGLLALTLTPSVGVSYVEYEAARRDAKAHLGPDVFWPRDPNEKGRPRRVPAFDFGPHPSPGFLRAAGNKSR